VAIIKSNPTLNEERVYTDVPVRGAQGDNFYAKENFMFERITDTAAPGGARSLRGHVHDGAEESRDGRGIRRVVDGGFYMSEESGQYITNTTTASTPGESIATGLGARYENAAGDFVMGIARVSPGIEAIKVEYLCEIIGATVTNVNIHNITDDTWSGAQVITATNTWYTSGAISVTRTAANRSQVRRIELDIWWYVAAGSEDIVFYHAYPFEYTDQP